MCCDVIRLYLLLLVEWKRMVAVFGHGMRCIVGALGDSFWAVAEAQKMWFCWRLPKVLMGTGDA